MDWKRLALSALFSILMVIGFVLLFKVMFRVATWLSNLLFGSVGMVEIVLILSIVVAVVFFTFITYDYLDD